MDPWTQWIHHEIDFGQDSIYHLASVYPKKVGLLWYLRFIADCNCRCIFHACKDPGILGVTLGNCYSIYLVICVVVLPQGDPAFLIDGLGSKTDSSLEIGFSGDFEFYQ